MLGQFWQVLQWGLFTDNFSCNIAVEFKCYVHVIECTFLNQNDYWSNFLLEKGSGFGSVSRAIASDTRGLQFESSQQQNLYWKFVYC